MKVFQAARIAQIGECQAVDQKNVGSILVSAKKNFFLHSMEKKSTKVDFSPISCKKAPFYTRNGHF